jgi:hypothetical protein
VVHELVVPYFDPISVPACPVCRTYTTFDYRQNPGYMRAKKIRMGDCLCGIHETLPWVCMMQCCVVHAVTCLGLCCAVLCVVCVQNMSKTVWTFLLDGGKDRTQDF